MWTWKRVFGKVLSYWKKVSSLFNTKNTKNTDLGKLGEDLAANFLKRKGFKILTKNWIYGKGEIDLVALEKCHNILVFVEVKLRSSNASTSGYFAVDGKKKNILRKTCKAYLRKFGSTNTCYRFDVVAIKINQAENSHMILHYENVKLF
ncbi:MAG: YraN family protein [Puniceicoccales bacterium]|jgi:putative endonuclease|nr:YraN family protein [Puniceicoccales bacterium]